MSGLVLPSGDMAVELLVEAGAVLASSLELTTTMEQVAQLTVPRLADLCVIDLRSEDGSIKEVAVAAKDPVLAAELERLRMRHPLDPDGEHPVARVIRSGKPELLAEMTNTLLRSFAQGSEHARFMTGHRYHSAAVAPLLARGRTLGALSVLRLGESEPYQSGDMELTCELARRAALALDNARLFSEVHQVEQRLEAILVNVAEAITLTDAEGRMVFANQAAADLLGVSTPAELTSARPGTIMPRFLVLDEHGRELGLEHMPGRRLFTGEQPEPLLVRNIVRATGEERWLIVRASPVSDPDSGRVRYAVNVFENITEVKRVEVERTRIAKMLEAALLPESLPEIPGAEIASLYRAAGELNDVGGDFYDVLPYGASRWLLMIGDVCGKGPRAAGVTALARHTLRTAAMLGQTPAGMLATLHKALRNQPAGSDLCTVCLVTLERRDTHAQLTVTLAGHPPPLLIGGEQEHRQIGKPGTLLGVLDSIDVHEVDTELHAQQTLLLYTDGLPDAGRAGLRLDEQRLLELCAATPQQTLDDLLERIERAAHERAEGRLRDDIALLALRLRAA